MDGLLLERLMRGCLLFIGITSWSALATGAAHAQIYDNPQNLKVLPPDISAEDLRDTMKSFSLATGLRCSACHAGEEGDALTSYDFASDTKTLKQTARAMLMMVNAINAEHIQALGGRRAQVTCITCHRGLRSPRTTAEMLTEAADEAGVEGIATRYRTLKERYYGTHSYDFSEFLLGEFARSRARLGKPEEALAMLDIMSEENPDSYWVAYLYGETFEGSGEIDLAVQHYRKAIELNPEAAGFVRGRLQTLQPDAEAFKRMMAQLTDGTGVWVQDNPDFATDSNAPSHWLQHYRIGPGERAFRMDSYAVSRSGACTRLLHSVSIWDEKSMVAKSFAESPTAVFWGEYSFPDVNSRQLLINGILPNGALLEMKDVMDLSIPGVLNVQGASKQEGEWVEADAVAWLSSNQANPCLEE